ncbi:MAG: HAD family hydrolase [Thermoplasmata archaeon]|nr:HAD family hydrolase [Thermoplasmata archaeon]MCI4359374.1 HAD family hydrolase [Thermoplasmata archaeon]
MPGGGPRKAVFVDRDGTLNPDLKYLREAERLEVYRGVIAGIRILKAHGYLIVCVTNQSGVERGFYTDADVTRIHERVNQILGRGGVAVDRFYYCPHAPEHGCECRKPGTKLFRDAANDLGIAWARSAVIGDRVLDIEAGDRLGLCTVLVPSRGHREEVLREYPAKGPEPDLLAPSFYGAAVRILHRG